MAQGAKAPQAAQTALGSVDDSDPRWMERESMEDRYAHVSGNLRQEAVQNDFLVDPDCHLDFFDEEGNELLSRDIDNDGGDEDNIEMLAVSIETDGLMEGVRGVAQAVPNTSSRLKRAHTLLGHATFAEATYRAAKRSPNNPHVLRTIRKGLDHAHLWHFRTPRYARRYIKETHNKYGGSRKKTPMEVMRNAIRANASWLQHADKEQIRVRQCGKGEFSWESLRWEHISSKYPSTFKSKHFFGHVTTVCSFLAENKRLEDFCSKLSKEGKFTELEVTMPSADTIVANFHTILQVIQSNFAKHYDRSELTDVIVEGMLLCVRRQVAPDIVIAEALTKHDEETVRLLLYPMGGVVKKAKKQKETRGRKGKGKGTANANTEKLLQQTLAAAGEPGGNDSSKITSSAGEVRDRLFFDDAMAAISSILRLVPAEGILTNKAKEAYAAFLTYAFTGSVIVDGKQHKTWTAARKAIQTYLFVSHKHCIQAAPRQARKDDDDKMPILDSLNSELLDVLEPRITLDKESRKRMAVFLVKNKANLPLKMQPAFKTVSANCTESMYEKMQCQGGSGVLPVRDVVTVVGQHMFDEMAAEWFSYASDLPMIIQRQHNLPTSATDLFEKHEDVAMFLQCRAKFAMKLFTDFLAGADRVCGVEDDFSMALYYASENLDVIAMLDACCRDVKDWSECWSRLLCKMDSEIANVDASGVTEATAIKNAVQETSKELFSSKKNPKQGGEDNAEESKEAGGKEEEEAVAEAGDTEAKTVVAETTTETTPPSQCLKDLVGGWLQLSEDIDIPAWKIKFIMESIRFAFHEATLKRPSTQADSGLDTLKLVHVAGGGEHKIIAQKMTQKLRLNMIGRVTLARNVLSCIEVGKHHSVAFLWMALIRQAWQHIFFIQPGLFGALVMRKSAQWSSATLM